MANGLFTLKQQVEALRQGAWSGYIAPKWVEYLVVAGGGGTGSYVGGGGAGGLLTGIVTVAAGTSYTVTVGSGGAGTSSNNVGNQGQDSVFGSILATGGGAGATPGGNGGSGGGSGQVGNATPYFGGQGVSGQGNAGGSCAGGASPSTYFGGGGGGGAGTFGFDGSLLCGGNGGAGIASAITGSVVVYAGGGGGAGYSDGGPVLPGNGGIGGGGTGGYATFGSAGTVNTGGGGGGGTPGGPGWAGGSGIVVVRYPGNVQFFSGGTINYTNGHIVHIFTTSGTLAPILPVVYNTSHQISRSLRFNGADSANLSRTFGTPTNANVWTFSCWIKRSTLGAYSTILGRSGSTYPVYQFVTSTNTFGVYDSGSANTTAVFRDPSAWYHLVIQRTDSTTVTVYFNGVSQLTATSQTNAFNLSGSTYTIGKSNAGEYFDGYMTEVNFIDGQALTPASFGATSTTTGVWAPIRYLGTYGTNGFYLNFSDNSNTTAATLGADYSGNGNNWTPNNFSVTAGAGNDSLVDTPTQYGFDTGVGGSVRGNYNTMNPVNKGSTVTLTNGNLDQVTASGGWNSARGTIGVSSGKWYWEVTITGTTQLVMHGVDDNAYNVTTNPSSTYVGAYTNSWGVYTSNGDRRNNTGSGTAYGSAFAQNDVMMVALDMDTGKIWWGKNGTWFASGSPSAGTNAAYTNLSGYTLNPATSCFDTTDNCTHNFGQRAFAYTAPSGYKALCTTNLPTPAIGGSSETLAPEYFNVVTWTGTGTSSSRSITGVGFQPDFVWSKPRSTSYQHNLYDVVRGSGKRLISNDTAAEVTNATYGYLSSFDSDGFSTAAGSTNNENWNETSATYVAWNWKAGGTAVLNKLGTINSTVSANPTAGFSIVTYTGTGANATVGHGLNVAPSMVIYKKRTSGSTWIVYHASISPTNLLTLNESTTQQNLPAYFNSLAPTYSVLNIGSNTDMNASGASQLAYCFAPVAGYSAFGSYTGNGSTNGPFIHTGFRPAYVMIRRSSSTGDWFAYNNKTSPSNAVNQYNVLNTSGVEGTYNTLDFLSNGFKLRVTDVEVNGNGSTIIYMAFAENPFKHSLAR
jgi:hypothetical protein